MEALPAGTVSGNVNVACCLAASRLTVPALPRSYWNQTVTDWKVISMALRADLERVGC